MSAHEIGQAAIVLTDELVERRRPDEGTIPEADVLPEVRVFKLNAKGKRLFRNAIAKLADGIDDLHIKILVIHRQIGQRLDAKHVADDSVQAAQVQPQWQPARGTLAAEALKLGAVHAIIGKL